MRPILIALLAGCGSSSSAPTQVTCEFHSIRRLVNDATGSGQEIATFYDLVDVPGWDPGDVPLIPTVSCNAYSTCDGPGCQPDETCPTGHTCSYIEGGPVPLRCFAGLASVTYDNQAQVTCLTVTRSFAPGIEDTVRSTGYEAVYVRVE